MYRVCLVFRCYLRKRVGEVMIYLVMYADASNYPWEYAALSSMGRPMIIFNLDWYSPGVVYVLD